MNCLRPACVLCLLLVAWVCLSEGASAPSAAGFGPRGEEMSVTPEREAAAMTFARRHHDELARLLKQLKEMDAPRYENAISELFRTSERLTRLRERQPDRYESELAIWKLDSRIRLLAARSAAGMDDELRGRIKALLIDRNELRASQLEADRERIEARLSRMNETIENLRTNREQVAERELERLLGNVRSRATIRPGKKPESR